MARRRALALLSGGLDSMLAARVVKDQGVDVEAVNFFTGFCVEGHTRALRADKGPRRGHDALRAADEIGVKLHFVDVSEDYKPVVLAPRFGYGQHMNPCLDCKIFLVGRAREIADREGFDFLVTGEVLGQRPKSQRPEALPLVAREGGAEDRVLRPLSAKHLPPTLPEREGWVDRDALFDFHGRNRKPQLALAERLGITSHAQPSGGCCFLADEAYSRKLDDLLSTRPDDARDYALDEVVLLKVGRHLRCAPEFKLIVGREEGENRHLRGYAHRWPLLEAVSHEGPVALVDGTPDADQLELAARVVARYGRGRTAPLVCVRVREPDGRERELEVRPLRPDEVPDAWML